MSDRRRIVTIADDGTVTTVVDLENGSTYLAVRDSFTVKPGVRQQMLATIPRRYAGATVVGETHDNGEITWQALISGTSADVCITHIEDLLSVLEQPRLDLFFEWRPDGASNSVFYEIRGPATYVPSYSWVQFSGAQMMPMQITIPVGPLARGLPTALHYGTLTIPGLFSVTPGLTGDAPALADIAITRPAGFGVLNPAFALIGWHGTLGVPVHGGAQAFGLIEGEAADFTLNAFAATADAGAHGGNMLTRDTSTIPTNDIATWLIEPSTVDPDDFSRDEVEIEVWARVKIASTVINPTLSLSAKVADGAGRGAQSTSEWGSAGRPLTVPSSGTRFRLTRLGTVTMSTTPGPAWHLQIAAAWDTGSTGTLAIDYLVLVPARQRIVSPTGEPNDSSYPEFMVSGDGTNTTTKIVRSDLSGQLEVGTLGPAVDSGMGGTPIELPIGTVYFWIVLSDVVPDDPTASADSMALAFSSYDCTVTVTPRYWLARGQFT